MGRKACETHQNLRLLLVVVYLGFALMSTKLSAKFQPTFGELTTGWEEAADTDSGLEARFPSLPDNRSCSNIVS